MSCSQSEDSHRAAQQRNEPDEVLADGLGPSRVIPVLYRPRGREALTAAAFWHYLDASAMVKVVANDPDEGLGRETLRRYYFSHSMYRASSFCVAEALSAFKVKWLRGRCSQEEYFTNVREFFRLVVSPLQQEECPLAVQVQQEAERLMQVHKLDFIDSIQIVTLLKGSHSGLVGASQSLFITADKALAAAARSEGARVWDCTSEEAPS